MLEKGKAPGTVKPAPSFQPPETCTVHESCQLNVTIPQGPLCGDHQCPLHGDHPNTCVAQPMCSRGYDLISLQQPKIFSV